MKKTVLYQIKNRLSWRLTAPLAFVLAVLFIVSGCNGPVLPGVEGGIPEGSDTQATPVNGTEEKTVKRGFSSWEDRTMEEILEVGGVTAVTSDLDGTI